MGGVCGVAGPDRKWAEAARDAGVTEECKSPHGKSAEATRKAHREARVAVGAGETTVEVGVKAASMAMHGTSAVVASGLSVVTGAAVHFIGLYKSLAESAELKDAHQRDAINLAVVWTAAGALPKDYVARVGNELRAVSGERGGASKILTPLMKDDAKWQKLKAEAEAYVRMGQKHAARSGITSRRELEYRLQHDSKLTQAYKTNIAFKHGVDSFVFQCERARIAKGT